jgi:hypothetical protein
MAKTTGPFLSLDARGTVGGVLTASVWKGINYMRLRVVPKNPKSFKQLAIRAVITDASKAWSSGATVGSVTINASYKAAFATAVEGTAMSGFDLFMQNCVAINYDKTTSPYYDGTLVAPSDPTDIGA